jgi:hypothetical protein
MNTTNVVTRIVYFFFFYVYTKLKKNLHCPLYSYFFSRILKYQQPISIYYPSLDSYPDPNDAHLFISALDYLNYNWLRHFYFL